MPIVDLNLGPRPENLPPGVPWPTGPVYVAEAETRPLDGPAWQALADAQTLGDIREAAATIVGGA